MNKTTKLINDVRKLLTEIELETQVSYPTEIDVTALMINVSNMKIKTECLSEHIILQI